MIIISDTSPITSLAAIGKLNLLHLLYGSITIPLAVYNELTQHQKNKFISLLFISLRNIISLSTNM